MMQSSFAPESAAAAQWRSTVLQNYRFAAQIFAVLFGIAFVGQVIMLGLNGVPLSEHAFLSTLPLTVVLLAGIEWRQARQFHRLLSSTTAPSDAAATSIIWRTVGPETLVPLAGYALIGNLLGWPNALGGPPLLATVVIPLISILRLDYRICLLQGGLGAIGYWSMAALAPPALQINPDSVSIELALNMGKGLIILGTGALAGTIARQNRHRLLDVIRVQQERAQVQGKLRTRTAEYHRAEDIILEKNELISILSHDLRAPLDGVASLAQLMARAPEQFTLNDIRKYAKEIQQTAHKLRELLDNLVVWAELKSGQPTPPSESLFLADLVTPVIQLMEPAIIARNLTIESDFSRDTVVLGNPAAIGTVIRNLVSNAVKYSPAAGRITLSTVTSENAEQIALAVTDAGPGLPPAQRASASNPAHTESASPPPPTTGRPELGLALCRQLLRQLGGSLEMLDAKGQGTEARMWLPRS